MSAEQIQKWTAALGEQWDVGNCLWKIRQGVFDEREAARFESVLKQIRLADTDQQLDREFVSVLWYIPMLLHWNLDRVAKKGGQSESFTAFMMRVEDQISEILGLPNRSHNQIHTEGIVADLQREWQNGGFLEKLSRGIFDENGSQRFERLLNCVDIPEDAQSIDRQLVSSTWKVPLHLERLADNYLTVDEATAQQIARYADSIENALQGILGIP